MYMYEMYVRFEHCGGKFTSIYSYLQLFRQFFEHYFISYKPSHTFSQYKAL